MNVQLHTVACVAVLSSKEAKGEEMDHEMRKLELKQRKPAIWCLLTEHKTVLCEKVWISWNQVHQVV